MGLGIPHVFTDQKLGSSLAALAEFVAGSIARGTGRSWAAPMVLSLIGRVAKAHPFKFGCVFSSAKTSFSDWIVQTQIERRESPSRGHLAYQYYLNSRDAWWAGGHLMTLADASKCRKRSGESSLQTLAARRHEPSFKPAPGDTCTHDI